MANLEYCVDVVTFRGHPNTRAEHPTTLEVTKDEYLTPRGDCIVGIAGSKGASELSSCLKDVLRRGGALLAVILTEDGLSDYVLAWGSEEMDFSNDRKIIIRRSSYIDGSTIGTRASKAAKDLSRNLVESLKQGKRGFLVLIAFHKEAYQETPLLQ